MTPGEIFQYIFFGAALVQFVFFLVFYLRLWFGPKPGEKEFSDPVTVIICARNEEENLLEHLPLVFAQDYPEFEVVVVDDCSLDNTANVLRAFQAKQPNLKIVPVYETEQFYGGKKYGLTLGIKAATHEHLLLTDADCRPASDQWLRTMVAPYAKGKSVILGHGAYEKGKGFLNMLIRYDTVQAAMSYFAFAMAGQPYMAVGRNLSYRKSLFFKHKGFASHLHLLSGDDDLFVNEVANGKNTAWVMEEGGHTISKAKNTWGAWWRQKRRHLTTGTHYKARYKWLLGLLGVSQLVYFVAAIVALILLPKPWIVLGVIGGRVLLQMITFSAVMKRLKTMDLLWSPVVFEVLLLAFYLALGVSNLIAKSSRWTK